MTHSRRLTDRADLTIAILILACWSALTISRYWGSWPPDLSALYLAGKFYASGQFDLIYATPNGFFAPIDPRWTAELSALGHPDAPTFPFIYPPIWAAIAAPLTQFAPTTFFNAAYVTQISLLGASILLAYRAIRPPVSLTLWCGVSCALLTVSLISMNAIYHNQFQIFVTFLTLLALERHRAGGSGTAGVLIAIAASIKIMPAALCLLFVLNRDARALIAALWTAFAITTASILIAGDLNLTYLAQLREISTQIAVINVNFSLTSGLYQLTHPSEAIVNHTLPNIPWITAMTYAAFLGSIALIAKSEHHWTRKAVAIIIATSLCTPIAWPHHFLPALILLPSVFAFMRPKHALAFLAVFGALTSTTIFDAATHWISPHHHTPALLNITVLAASFAIFLFCPKTRA